MLMLDRKLEIFRMAATLNHFSEAAAALGMTQPNVTHQIALLEAEFDTALFEREGRRLHLTAAGEALLRECNRLFDDAEQVRRLVRNAAGAMRHYRVGGTMTAGGYILPRLIAHYMQRNPLHNISLHIANTDEISTLLKTRQLDLALVEGRFDEKLFLSTRLQEDELFAVAAPGQLPAEFSLAEYLQNEGRFVLRENGSGTRWHFDRFLAEQGLAQPSDDHQIVANSFDAIKHLVRSGNGLTVISDLAVADELKAGTLQLSRFQEGKIRRGIDFIYLPGENLRFAENFIAFCRTQIKKETGSADFKRSIEGKSNA